MYLCLLKRLFAAVRLKKNNINLFKWMGRSTAKINGTHRTAPSSGIFPFGIAGVLLALAQLAHAAPSYVGPWTYIASGPPAHMDTVVWSAEEGHAAVLASWSTYFVGTPYESTWCNYRMGDISPWNPTYWQPVEGVEAAALQYFTLFYDLGCPQGAVPRTGQQVHAVKRERIVCGSSQRFNRRTGKCDSGGPVVQVESTGGNMGGACPVPGANSGAGHCGQPINTMTGNMWHTIDDYLPASRVGFAGLRRTYNSSPISWRPLVGRNFGRNWTALSSVVIRRTELNSPGENLPCWQFPDWSIECPLPYVPSDAVWTGATIFRADGKSYQFKRSGNNWEGPANVTGRLNSILASDSATLIGFDYIEQSGVSERFDQDGILLSITDRNGRVERLTYSDGASNDTAAGRYPADAPACSSIQEGATMSAGLLLCITDHWGRQLQFNYDVKGRISKMIDPANETYFYEYDGASGGCVPGNETTFACRADNLTKVTYPGGGSHTYYYNEISHINGGVACSQEWRRPQIGNGFGRYPELMTGLVDENGIRKISWTYDCDSRATSSGEANGVNQVKMSYTAISPTTNSRVTTVTHTLGTAAEPRSTVSTFNTKFVLGVGKNVSIDQPCVECGQVRARSYDENGNVDATTDFRGIVTSYRYDPARNLETSRTEAVGTPEERTITTSWHASLRLPRQIAEPSRITTMDYDAKGNLLTKTIRATTDKTGALGLAGPQSGPARVWSYTYYPDGQLETVTEPRTDVVAKTTYEYDSHGNLSKVTNAAGHVTKYTNYDANGRVGLISKPNGVTTSLLYTPRGWLRSSTVSAGTAHLTTDYDYDFVGNLKQVRTPGAGAIDYTYDAANRLTDIADQLGNRIHYTLDNTGNRIKEEVTDSSGTLARHVSRVFDNMNRLQAVTGAQQ